MIKIFLFAFIFALVSSKSATLVKLGVNTTYDMNDTLFKFEYNGPGNDIILFYFDSDVHLFSYDISCREGSKSGGSDLLITIRQIAKNGTCTIRFRPEEYHKGSFVIYTLNNKLSIKLKNKYGNLFSGDEENTHHWLSASQLTFLVPKLDRDITANFEYSKSAYVERNTINIDNPFKVCCGNVCHEDISTYEFKKGQSYEISIKLIEFIDEYDFKYAVIPGFAFYDKKYNGTYSPDDLIINSTNFINIKLLLIALILLLL